MTKIVKKKMKNQLQNGTSYLQVIYMIKDLYSKYVKNFHMKLKVLVAQSCPTLCDSMDWSPQVHGILQARILEWGAIPSSRGPSQPRD